ncbi:MAG: hypothetical protein JWL91_2728 [Sphingomonas bacterium]|nr:hypothetical protein [Sphingomonas bacterium]MDB5690852.1 hypothetical protein [Sphingomonas bacterium]
MSGTRDSLEAAQDAARDARTKLSDTFCQIKARLQPSALAGQARERIREEVSILSEKAVATAGDRPALVGMTGGAILLFFLRKPLGRLIGRMFSREKTKAERAPS